MTVYLAGSIEGISLEEATQWRGTATSFFAMHGVATLDPTRRKKFHDEVYSTNLAKKIVKLDLNDIEESKVILLNLRARGAGKAWGSICEMVLANSLGKTVITVLEPEFKHPFVDVYSTEIHPDLETALVAALAYYR
jgi:hypothetical protein